MVERRASAHVPRRRRIGFLGHGLWDPVGSPLWQGALEGAREGGADLYCFIGSDLGADRLPFESQANIIYDLAGADNIEGLVVSAGALGGIIGAERMREFLGRFGEIPLVTISIESAGHPVVLIDNYRGMYDLVSHCIAVHGCRRLVFLPGPWGSSEVKERYRAYVAALKDHGLADDPALVTPPGEWSWRTGQRAIGSFLDAGKVDFDAVIVANDRMAIGAMEELKRRGFSVPEKVIVTGFDDTLDALFAVPPLTTVHQPLFYLARQATGQLLSLLEGRRVSARTILPARPEFRASCGCGGTAVGAPETHGKRAGRPTHREFMARVRKDREHTLARMHRVLRPRPVSIKADWAARLFDAFAADMDGRRPGEFPAVWEELIGRATLAGRTIELLREALCALKSVVPDAGSVSEARTAGDLFAGARAALGEAVKQAEIRKTWVKSQRLHLSLELINSLNAVSSLEEMTAVLARNLESIGITGCVLALSVRSEDPLGPVRPVLVHRQGFPASRRHAVTPYPARRLGPASFLKSRAPQVFVVMPLFFNERRFGFVVFTAGTTNGEAYENVRLALCSNLQRLHVLRLREEAEASQDQAYTEVERQVQERTRQIEVEVAERRRTEEALLEEQYLTRSLMDNTPDFIYFKDGASRFIRLNEALARHLGLSSPADGIGRLDSDFFAAPFAAKTLEDERRVMETGRPVIGIEERELWPDGRESWTSTTKLPLRDAEGRIIGTIGISRDITDRKRAEAEVRRLNEELEDRVRERTAELEDANRELESFSYSVSHDLRAPLRAMDGFARILMDEFGAQFPSGALRHLATIVESARQMGRLIDGLLGFSRLSRQALTLRPVDMAELVRETLTGVRAEYEGRQVRWDVGDLPVCQGDSILLRQVWVNLISNALKFTRRRDEARIEIGSRTIAGRRVFFVKDNGVGFDMRYADKLFGVFQRLHRAEEYEGTGVGLATIQRIIHRHGGRIWAEAKPDQGATFYFMI
jgi:PAS domain S-box-containing protein